jgi:hypothetical protein
MFSYILVTYVVKSINCNDKTKQKTHKNIKMIFIYKLEMLVKRFISLQLVISGGLFRLPTHEYLY